MEAKQMSQVPVKYVKKGTLHEKPIPAFEANYIPVVELSALRVELLEIMPFCTKGQDNAYLSIAEIRERLERLLASLGEVGK